MGAEKRENERHQTLGLMLKISDGNTDAIGVTGALITLGRIPNIIVRADFTLRCDRTLAHAGVAEGARRAGVVARAAVLQ